MREVYGDLWSFECDARVVPTNGVVHRHSNTTPAKTFWLVMGAGVAKQAALLHPGLEYILGKHVHDNGNRPCYVRDAALISWPTKQHWHDPSEIEFVVAGASMVRRIADEHGLETIALPEVGCGLGGLRWSVVGPMLAKVLDDRFLVVHQR